ncbi:hypothetical protein IM725_05965 [Ramlibacter aquaticus]|uniref:Integrase n=1 Tax=Ramlibacter aquaticus TaxID=2780094 RepID=A0ABR9SDZ5_9BURK|nr:hypothetical protein [Ramlibacter aquaticus]MBE7940114.1 hypothetical protein [Ramlibacter aquaticus]
MKKRKRGNFKGTSFGKSMVGEECISRRERRAIDRGIRALSVAYWTTLDPQGAAAKQAKEEERERVAAILLFACLAYEDLDDQLDYAFEGMDGPVNSSRTRTLREAVTVQRQEYIRTAFNDVYLVPGGETVNCIDALRRRHVIGLIKLWRGEETPASVIQNRVRSLRHWLVRTGRREVIPKGDEWECVLGAHGLAEPAVVVA